MRSRNCCISILCMASQTKSERRGWVFLRRKKTGWIISSKQRLSAAARLQLQRRQAIEELSRATCFFYDNEILLLEGHLLCEESGRLHGHSSRVGQVVPFLTKQGGHPRPGPGTIDRAWCSSSPTGCYGSRQTILQSPSIS